MAGLAFGRKRPDPAHAARSIRLASILKPRAVPDYPPLDDNFEDYGLGDWPMDGNDLYGDCVAVAVAHLRRLYSKALTGIDRQWSLEQVYEFYRTQNPGFVEDPNNPVEDNGMDVQTALEYLLHSGGPDGVKLVAFAAVDFRNAAEVRAAMHIFGGALIGAAVQSKNMDDFYAGKAWAWRKADDVVGLHCTIGGGFNSNSTIEAWDAVTWGEAIHYTDGYWVNGVDELWVGIWPELMQTARFADNIDLQALAQQFAAITHGGVLPVPPTPQPVPGPDPVPDAWGRALVLLERIATALEAIMSWLSAGGARK